MKISILIPTCNRPALLKECLRSCLDQTYPAVEILIGDDSHDDDTKLMVKGFSGDVAIDYQKNEPPLGQAANVDALMRKAKGDCFCLIHDDDLLEAEALALLRKPFEHENVIISFGKQRVITHHGIIMEDASVDLNNTYYRTERSAGVQKDLLKAAILQQIPNNGFLVEATCARAASYLKAGQEYGDGCDFGFAHLLALQNQDKTGCFVDAYVARYRLSEESISRTKKNNGAAYMAFFKSYDYGLMHYRTDSEIKKAMEARVQLAIGNAIELGHFREAWQWLLSPFYRRRLLTPRGIKKLLLLFCGLLTRGFRREA